MFVDQLLPGIPLIESPLLKRNLASMALTAAEKEVALALHEKGYAVIDFPDANIDERVDRIKENLGPRFGIVSGEREGIVSIQERRVQDAWQFDNDVKAIAANAAVLDLLSKLYGRRAFPFQTLNFPVGTEQAAHTDSVHFSSIPERFMCGVWLAMEDITPDAGPLMYVPGSHRWPILNNSLIGRRGWQSQLDSAQTPYQGVWDAIVETSGIQAEIFLPRKGQALIWCANLLHGGSHQVDPGRTRWSQVTHYFFDDCIYYTPAFSDEPLGKLAVRKITNIADGQAKPNTFLGEEISATTPPLGQKRRGKRWLRSLLGR